VGALIGGFNHLLQVLAQRQQALQESEARFRALADNASALVWMTGVDSRASYFNQIWLDFTGRSLAQEVGNGWAQGVHPDDLQRSARAYQSAFGARQAFSIDYRLRRFDGVYSWLTLHGAARHDDQGAFLGYIGTGIDITERKQSEEKLQLLASVFSIGHYVALISDITALKQHESQLQHIAHFDALTQLPNRTLLGDRLQQALAGAQRRGQLLAVVFLDMDGFKAIIDQHGHEAGGQCRRDLLPASPGDRSRPTAAPKARQITPCTRPSWPAKTAARCLRINKGWQTPAARCSAVSGSLPNCRESASCFLEFIRNRPLALME
jgi:PAS domain S-box-containing protein